MPPEGEVHCSHNFCEPCEFNTVFGQDAQAVTGGDGSFEEQSGERLPDVRQQRILAVGGQVGE